MDSQGDTDSVARRRRLPDDVAGADKEVITSALYGNALVVYKWWNVAIDGDSIDHSSLHHAVLGIE
jgi:hypothetical protein